MFDSREFKVAITLSIAAAGVAAMFTFGLAGAAQSAPEARTAPAASAPASVTPVPPSNVPGPPAQPAVSVPARSRRTAAPPHLRVIRIAAQVAPSEAQAAIDRCIGPVEYQWQGITDVVQHSYCGGTAMISVANGQLIQIVGGNISGTYRVNGRRMVLGFGQPMNSTAGIGDVALQSCIGNDQMMFVGLTRVA